MCKPAGLPQRLVDPRPSLINAAESRQCLGKVCQHHGVWVFRRLCRIDGAVRWIIQAMTPLEEGESRYEFPEMEAGHAMHAVAQQSQHDIVLRLPDLLDPFGERQRQPQLGASEVERPLAPE